MADCDASSRKAVQVRAQKVISFGFESSDLQIIQQTPQAQGQALTLSLFGQEHEIFLPLAGRFQAENVVCALGLVHACGTPLDDILPLLSGLKGVAGRLERVGSTPAGGTLYVDYAHTPDALETVIEALSPHCAGDLWVLAGCGGDRDKGKRPLMGAVIENLADHGIVTDDNPRSEDPASIRAEILAATPHSREIADRREAIFEGAKALKKGDILILAGKGHESGQIIGDTVIEFDDRQVAREAIEALEKDDKKA